MWRVRKDGMSERAPVSRVLCGNEAEPELFPVRIEDAFLEAPRAVHCEYSTHTAQQKRSISTCSLFVP